MKIKIFFSVAIYLLIGLKVYWLGYIEAPSPQEAIGTFLVIVLFWPAFIIGKLL